ncbi:GNAT family N-acetyltransferase [Lentzea sp. DG1S-22]|uniref:GNAT family N-acetyltransferase n=1 Tax=Lentzea sp. DG1S-22 TaxID=3108822 RepID=UPI002E777118|nr:GNAT family N-acetyltransferase [Lentzea sp. DG1S-22]WVH77910.1 GNAT family N-acetyltransferase [Lentzea sp. DG1S-22]
MVDPLRDPDDPELLDPYQSRSLAILVEGARLASGAVRYGKVGRVGCAAVVINRENPLPSGNFGCALDGSSVEVASTLLQLEQTFADVGRAEAVVYASPTTVDEIEGIADDSGWYAVEELQTVVHRGSASVSAEVRRAVDADVPGIVELLSDELVGHRDRLSRWLGHRLDDPRCPVLVVDDGDRIGGFVSGFAERGVGLVEQCVVRPARRRRGVGRSLVVSAVATLRSAGAMLVASQVDEGPGEKFAEACGFVAAYPVTAYVRRVDELLD